MNKKIGLYMLGIVTLLGLFSGVNIVSADSAVPTCNSATLYGTVTPNGAPTSAWFDWGTTSALQYSTPKQTFNSTSSFNQVLSPLPENTTFYFRAMASNANGTATGQILSFTTTSCNTPPPATPPTVNLLINGSHTPPPIISGGVANVSWSSQPANSSTLSCTGSDGTGVWSGGKPLTGAANFNLTQSTTFSITCRDSSSGLSDTDSVYIAVNPVAPQVCQDTSATNYGGTLPCRYPVQTCQDTSALNFGGTLPCRYPVQTCQDTSALNFGGTLPCRYPVQTCQDTSALNFGGTLPCRYPVQTCQDTSAINYGGTLPCRYPVVQTCQDTNATNYGGTLPCVYPILMPTINIYADQTNVAYNGGTIVRWTSTNATSCLGSNGSNGWPGSRTISGSFYTGQLTNTTTFSITCNNNSGSAGSAVTIYVANQPLQNCQDVNATNYGGALPCHYPVVQTCQDPSATNYGGALPCRYPVQTCQDTSAINYGGTLPCRYQTLTCQDVNATNYGGALPCRYSNIQPTVNLSADNTSLSFDESTTIRWNTTNATFCNATGGTNGWSGTRNTSGTFYTGTVNSTRTFGITCSNANGNSVSDSVTLYVDNNGSSNTQPSVNIYADDTNLNSDDSTRIRWDSTNADYCNATGGTNGWSGNRSTSGSFNTGSLTFDETYRIVCTNTDSGRTNTDSVTVYVDNNNNNNNSNRPSVTISADRTNISSNESTLIRWYPNNANYCSASGGSNGWSGNKSTSGGSFNTGSISRTTTYSINCTNNNGSDSDSVTIYVNNNNNNNYYTAPAATAPTAITTAATQISNTSAQLNSLIFTSGSDTTTWFEWGTTTNLGSSTNQSSIGSIASTTHSDTITGLTTGVTYYFRAAAENSYLRNYGNIMSFTMQNLGGVAGTSTIIRPTTIINRGGTQSLVMLTIDGGSENIAPLERRNYQVTWKNISSQTLGKVVLRVILPKSFTFESANKGSFSSDDNTVTLEIGTLNPGETDNMFLLASAGNNLNQGELMVTVANLVYTDQSNAQGNAIAYATQRADLSGSVLGANAFGAGFLPSSFLGWLLLLILLLIILLLSRYLYNQFKGPQPPVVVQH